MLLILTDGLCISFYIVLTNIQECVMTFAHSFCSLLSLFDEITVGTA